MQSWWHSHRILLGFVHLWNGLLFSFCIFAACIQVFALNDGRDFESKVWNSLLKSVHDFRLCVFVCIEIEVASLRISLLPEAQSTLCPPFLISQAEFTLSSISKSQHFKVPTLVWLPWCQCCNVFAVANGKCGGYSKVALCSREVCSWICLRGIGCAWNFLNRGIICIISYQILEARSMHVTNSASYPILESLPGSYIKSIYCCYFCFLIWIHSILSQKDLLIKHDHFLSEQSFLSEASLHISWEET